MYESKPISEREEWREEEVREEGYVGDGRIVPGGRGLVYRTASGREATGAETALEPAVLTPEWIKMEREVASQDPIWRLCQELRRFSVYGIMRRLGLPRVVVEERLRDLAEANLIVRWSPRIWRLAEDVREDIEAIDERREREGMRRRRQQRVPLMTTVAAGTLMRLHEITWRLQLPSVGGAVDVLCALYAKRLLATDGDDV